MTTVQSTSLVHVETMFIFCANCVIYVFLQYFDTVGWVLTCKNRWYNLYCVGGDVKPCSINQSIKNRV